jgi:uncharacterized membrane protein
MSEQNNTNQPALAFRWRYVAAPFIFTAACLIFCLAFVFTAPNPLPFRFDADGSVLNSMNKFAFVALILICQAIGVLVAAAVAQTIIKLSQTMLKSSTAPVALDGFVLLMSNMVLLPQVILAYLMVDAFISATWSVHLISFLLFAIIAATAGIAILAVAFIRVSSKMNSVINKP